MLFTRRMEDLREIDRDEVGQVYSERARGGNIPQAGYLPASDFFS